MKCSNCNKEAVRIKGWFEDGEIQHRCEHCGGFSAAGGGHEFIPQSLKDDRKKYAKDMLQPYRGEELSKEFVDAYPEATKKMIKAKAVTEKEVANAREVWKGDL